MAFWDVKYEANVKPDDDGWTLDGDDHSSAAGGILTIDSTYSDATSYRKNTTFNFNIGITIEFKARVISAEGTNPFFVRISNNEEEEYTDLVLRLTAVWGGGNVLSKICDIDTTSAYHTYKVKILGTTATLYINGVDKGNWEVSAAGEGSTGKVHFGDASSSASVNINIDYFYYAGSIDYGIPIVTTQAATNIKDIYCNGNGNITDNGGEVITERGFERGTSEEAQYCIRQTGTNLAIGAFSLTISGLKPETTYYYRAYATNSYGTAYGAWVSFTTNASPSYGIYEEDNTPTITFYLSEDDGMTWGQKRGPYTTDQADIEVTKLLVRGSGKKKIKFKTTALTGISASVMVKADIKV